MAKIATIDTDFNADLEILLRLLDDWDGSLPVEIYFPEVVEACERLKGQLFGATLAQTSLEARTTSQKLQVLYKALSRERPAGPSL